MPPRPNTSAARGRRTARQSGRILDLFAGAGGWEQALGMLGLHALGIETDPHACATARAAGHERLQADVSELDPQAFAPVWGLVGSPPCQAYSTAGKGLGRQDKPIVLACAHELAAGNDSRRAWREGCRDERSLLTVEPLRYVLALRPRWIALEQVPAVLELWSVFAGLLAEHGYQTAVGVLSAERYGLAQTRKRAFLLASLDGPVELPAPTHRSYNPRSTGVPEEELPLEPWVSMAEALGWGMSRRPAYTVVAGAQDGGSKSRAALARARQSPGRWVELRRGCERTHEQGGLAWRNGNQPHSAIRRAETPAPTVHFGHRANRVEWVPCGSTTLLDAADKALPAWVGQRPATTVACDRRVHPPGHKECAADPPGRYQQRRGKDAIRVTVAQAAVLQGFPADYPWQGPKTRQFEQVGNALPPLLARRVLEQALHEPAKGAR